MSSSMQGTQYVLASRDTVTLHIFQYLQSYLGLENMIPGTYDLRWFDCITCKSVEKTT